MQTLNVYWSSPLYLISSFFIHLIQIFQVSFWILCHYALKHVIRFLRQLLLRPHYGPGVDSSSNRNKYQEYFLGVKAAGAYGSQPYHLHVPIVLKSGSLNSLEPLGPFQACNGIALPLHQLLMRVVISY